MTRVDFFHDVIVYDEEYKAASQRVNRALVQLDQLFSNYVYTLNFLTSNGTIAGQTGEALKAYAEEAARVQRAIQKIASCHKKTSSCFLSDVDETDKELF